MKHLIPRLLITAVCSSLALHACTDDKSDFNDRNQVHNVNVDSHLRAVQSCSDLQEIHVDVLANQIIENLQYWQPGWGYDYGFGSAPNIDMDDAMPMAPEAGNENSDAGHDEPRDFTDTNLQETGVDEADIFKTDGHWAYTLGADQKIHIYNIQNLDEPTDVGTIPVKGQNVSLFLQHDQLVILTSVYGSNAVTACDKKGGNCELVLSANVEDVPKDMPPSYREVPDQPQLYGAGLTGTLIQIYDVKTPTEPQFVRELTVEGSSITSRVIHNTLYLAQSKWNQTAYLDIYEVAQDLNLEDRLDQDMQQRAIQLDAMRDEIREMVRSTVGNKGWDIRPAYQLADGSLHQTMDCADLYVPAATSGQESITSLIALDLSDASAAPTGAGILADGWLVYGSPQAFYIARNSTSWTWIDDTMATEKTDIHRFDLQDGHPMYSATGRIEGTVRDRFSMSEKDGLLRVVTTERNNSWWMRGPSIAWSDTPVTQGGTVPVDEDVAIDMVHPAEPDHEIDPVPSPTPQNAAQTAPPTMQNHLFILQKNENNLETIGTIEGFAPGESIYGTRFVGDMAYVTTFFQIDPLHSIDLSDPRNPVIRGELEIPGYSNYLQAIDSHWLIGIGQDVQDNRTSGVQVSLFDVSDRDNPKRHAVYTVPNDDPNGWGGSSSDAEYDSHAFTWYASRNLLAVPVQRWSSNSSHSYLLLLHISPETGIEVQAEIERKVPICYGENECQDQWISPRRAAFIEENLIVYSPYELSFWQLDALQEPFASFVPSPSSPLYYFNYGY